MTIYKAVDEPYFSYMVMGVKKYEGRIFKGDFSNLKLKDRIVWTNNGRELQTEVIGLFYYSTFEQMLTTLGVENFLPGIYSVSEGVKIYHTFPNYQHLESINHVMAIELSIIY